MAEKDRERDREGEREHHVNSRVQITTGSLAADCELWLRKVAKSEGQVLRILRCPVTRMCCELFPLSRLEWRERFPFSQATPLETKIKSTSVSGSWNGFRNVKMA